MEGDNHDFRVKIMIFGSFWKSWFSTFAMWKRHVGDRMQTYNHSSKIANLSGEPPAHSVNKVKNMCIYFFKDQKYQKLIGGFHIIFDLLVTGKIYICIFIFPIMCADGSELKSITLALWFGVQAPCPSVFFKCQKLKIMFFRSFWKTWFSPFTGNAPLVNCCCCCRFPLH